jgi:HAD superfamily hydrolase (TIGR01509 family)
MRPAALVFDFDGTIADTEYVEYEAARCTFADYGCDLPIEWWSPMVGTLQAVDLVGLLVATCGRPVDAGRVVARHLSYRRELLELLEPRPGVMGLLAAAAEAGVPVAVASNADEAWVLDRLKSLGLSRRFGAVVTIDHVAVGKPHPEPYLTACRRLGVPPWASVAFEDSEVGSLSAHRAGLWTVACPTSMSHGHVFDHVDVVVESLEEICLLALGSALASRTRG